MTRVITGLTVSLDGFYEDASGNAGRLYTDLADLAGTPYLKAMQAETGAVLMGRHTFDMGGDPDTYADTYELQVPLFVVTHRPPERQPKRNERLYFTFVTEGLESAVAQASAAAGDKAVQVVGGADVMRQLLAAGLADEVHMDVVPVLLGSGRRPFDGLDGDEVRLEKLSVEEAGGRTSLRYRVLR